jgi:uncharacterized membrane protein YjfL (UPF0719 family)
LGVRYVAVLHAEAAVIPEEENKMKALMEGLTDTTVIYEFLHPEGVLYFFSTVILLLIAKLFYNLLTPYQLNVQLTQKDNKAVAVSFSGYLLAVGIVILGVFNSETGGSVKPNMWYELLDTVIWGIVGIVLLNFARIINDKLLLSKFNNVKELIADKNIGTAAVEWGSYVGSAFIIYGAISGEDTGYVNGLITAGVYFIISQIAFILFGWIYQLISRYDLHKEIEEDNISAGLAFGMTLTAISIILSGYVLRYDSLIGFWIWFLVGLVMLVVGRYLVDKILLPGALLDEEISKDKNWGAAFVEGSVAIGLAFLITVSFL